MNAFRYSSIILLILLISNILHAQLQQVNINVHNTQGKPVTSHLEIKSIKDQKIIYLQCNTSGKTSAWLQQNNEYEISINNKIPFFRFKTYSGNSIRTLEIYPDSREKTILNSLPKGTLTLHVKNSQNKPMANETVILTEKQTNTQYKGITNTNGELELQLPISSSYELQYTNAPDYEKINIPDKLNAHINFFSTFEGSQAGVLHPSQKQCLFNMHYIDLDSLPVKGEEFVVRNLLSGKKYKAVTDQDGYAKILVPIGATYTVSTSYLHDFVTPEVPNTANLYEMVVEVSFLSTAELLKEKARRAKELAIRDSIALHRVAPIEQPAAIIKEEVSKRSRQMLDSLKSNAHSLEINNHIPSAILERKEAQWPNKVIVTDLTCSMDPYGIDILFWQKMQLLSTNKKTHYLFFNDGDGIPNEKKEDGKTGGIHHIFTSNIDSLIATMQLTRRLSPNCSGDGPENDLEAVIAGSKFISSNSTLILIADNLSDVRDMSLLSQIKVPVHIILCGVKDIINEDYLEIAYKTKGSIHLINNDYESFSEIKEGSVVNINRNNYRLIHGKFVKN
jgi:hypothetical protein